MADPLPHAETTARPLWTPSLPALLVLTGCAVAVVVFAIVTRTVGAWIVAASTVFSTATIWIRRRGPRRES